VNTPQAQIAVIPEVNPSILQPDVVRRAYPRAEQALVAALIGVEAALEGLGEAIVDRPPEPISQ